MSPHSQIPADALAGESVVARADALMRRRTGEDVPVLTEAVTPGEDDFPMLTHVAEQLAEHVAEQVTAQLAEQMAVPVAETPPSPAPEAIPVSRPAPVPPPATPDQKAIEKLSIELTKAIAVRMHAELPHLVHVALQETLTRIEKDMRSSIKDASEKALRQFLKDLADREGR